PQGIGQGIVSGQTSVLEGPCPLWVKSGSKDFHFDVLLYPQKRTSAAQIGMSAKGQKRTSSHSMTSSAIASTSGRNSKTEGFRRLEVDNELECGRLLNRHFRRLFILEKSISLSVVAFRTRSRTPLARAPSSTCAIQGFALFGLSNRWSLRDPTCDCVAMNLVLSPAESRLFASQ